jgi:hypothetical protein
MTWKCCRPLLWALSLLVAGSASAAKISFSEKGFVDVGALVQAQYRIEQDAAGSGKDPSHDFLLRRARLLISGQFNDNIGFILSTDVSYATGPGTNPNVPAAAVPPAAGGASPTATGVYNAMYLLDAIATYKVSKELVIDAGQMLLPYSHNVITSSSRLATLSTFPTFFAANAQRNNRDVGFLIRGLLVDDRIYYRMGVFNGVQTRASIPAAGTVGQSAGINPGDAPKFAGMLRFNIAGKEDGYTFCQVCFATAPIINVGVAAEYQANARRNPAPTGPSASTNTGMGAQTTGNADFFADIPFSQDLELSLEVLATRIWAGDGAAQSGFGVFGLISMRFGVIGPYAQIEWFNSDAAYVGKGNTTGDITTYRGGFSWYIEKHTYKISAEIAFQSKEKAGETVDGTLVPPNHWVGTLQFQVTF